MYRPSPILIYEVGSMNIKKLEEVRDSLYADMKKYKHNDNTYRLLSSAEHRIRIVIHMLKELERNNAKNNRAD